MAKAARGYSVLIGAKKRRGDRVELVSPPLCLYAL